MSASRTLRKQTDLNEYFVAGPGFNVPGRPPKNM